MQKLMLSTVAAATILLGAGSAFAVSDVNDEASRAFLGSPQQQITWTNRGGADLAIPGMSAGQGSSWLERQRCNEAMNEADTGNVFAYCKPDQR